MARILEPKTVRSLADMVRTRFNFLSFPSRFTSYVNRRNEPLHVPSTSIGAGGVAESELESVPPMSAVEQKVMSNINGGIH